MSHLFRFQIIFMVVLAISLSTFAFASSNEVSPAFGGEGVGEISGVTVTNVNYSVDADPSFLSSVEFDLDQSAGKVMASVDSLSGTFFECTNTGGNHWVCHTNTTVKISSLDQLRIVAVGFE